MVRWSWVIEVALVVGVEDEVLISVSAKSCCLREKDNTYRMNWMVRWSWVAVVALVVGGIVGIVKMSAKVLELSHSRSQVPV
jgi:hypothetical protein